MNAKLKYGFVAAAICVPLCFTLYTGQVWEDFFITFQHSRNLIEGNGLVYNPGERVHGFTSPINVLLPAVFYLITGAKSYLLALWGYRVVSFVFFAGAGYLVFRRILERGGASVAGPAIFFALYFLFDVKSVAYSANGQEAAFMIFFLSLALVCVDTGFAGSWGRGGFGWAGLLYTRPDGCVYIAVIALVALVLPSASRREEFLGILKAFALCAMLYLPWFVFVWVYYGNPIPQPVLAKIGGPSLCEFGVIKVYLTNVSLPFEPVYARFGGWPGWIRSFGVVAGIFCAGYWIVATNDRLGRLASLIFCLLCVYLSFVYYKSTYLPFPWYLPPVSFCGMIVLASAVWSLSQAYLTGAWQRGVPWVLNGLILIVLVAIFVMSSYQLRIQQQVIESGNRTRIGKWLRASVSSGESVYLEPLGYIGYFSQKQMLDYPGLASPRVVQLRRQKHMGKNRAQNMVSLIPDLEPDWLILRPFEVNEAVKLPYVRKHYSQVKEFDVTAELQRYRYIPGINYLYIDAHYIVLKRL